MKKREEFFPNNKFNVGERVMIPYEGGYEIGRVVEYLGEDTVTVLVKDVRIDLPTDTVVPHDYWAGNRTSEVGKVISLDDKVGIIILMNGDERLVYIKKWSKSGKLYWVNKDELKEGRITDSWTVNRSNEWIHGRIRNKDLEDRLSSLTELGPAYENTRDSLQTISCFSEQTPKQKETEREETKRQRTNDNLETKLGVSDYMMSKLCDLADSTKTTKEVIERPTNSELLNSLEELLTDEDMSNQNNLSKARDLIKELRKRI